MVDILWRFCDWVGIKKERKRRRKKEKTRENRDVESPSRQCVPRAAGTEGTSRKSQNGWLFSHGVCSAFQNRQEVLGLFVAFMTRR